MFYSGRSSTALQVVHSDHRLVVCEILLCSHQRQSCRRRARGKQDRSGRWWVHYDSVEVGAHGVLELEPSDRWQGLVNLASSCSTRRSSLKYRDPDTVKRLCSQTNSTTDPQARSLLTQNIHVLRRAARLSWWASLETRAQQGDSHAIAYIQRHNSVPLNPCLDRVMVSVVSSSIFSLSTFVESLGLGTRSSIHRMDVILVRCMSQQRGQPM